MDYKGPFSRSVHGNTGFYLITDHNSGAVWSHPCKDKGENVLFDILQNFLFATVGATQFKTSILHCDADSVELGEKITKYLIEKDIARRVSTPYTPYQNGLVERAMQKVLDKARTLLLSTSAPRHYWDYAVLLASRLINMTPNSKTQSTPHQVITGRAPDITGLIPFYCPGVYHRTKAERDRDGGSWEPKAGLCRFLGYDEVSKGNFKILTVPGNKILSRKDCIFDRDHLQYNIKQLTDTQYRERMIDFVDFEPDLHINEDKTVVGDSVAPYFPLTPDEYIEESKRMPRSVFSPSLEELSLSQDQDQHHALFSLENFYNDFASLSVHPPIALPPDPKDLTAALLQEDGELWREAAEKEFGNFRLREILKMAEDQKGRAMKTKLVLKYTYTSDYQLKRKVRFVVCGYSQIKNLDFDQTFAPTRLLLPP